MKVYGIIIIILYGFTIFSSAARQDAISECNFPQRWEGSWFLSGYQQSVHIKGSQINYRGKCKAYDGNKYLIVDEKGCHRCLVIYEKHKNVLQYKESECDGDSMYMDQSNPAALPMRSIVKSDHNRAGGAHPNLNGHSRLSSSDQYIMRSNDDSNDCFCRGREILQNLCDQIPGDALLYSLFREQAEPVKCPLKGPFTFTYNRGHGECKSPVSNIESCTDESRLLLNFQACPDVQGTESAAEELTCLATWKDGNSRYLVGLVSHHHAISNEERFRCFVYEKLSLMGGGFSFPGGTNLKDAEYKLAQSGDATCNGLDSAEVGSRIMTLRKPPITERCDFPIWFKGPRHWHGLMGKVQYIYHTSDGSMQIKKSNGNMETRAFCEQINKQTGTEMMAVVHHTTGCQSGFMCMMFYRRDTFVAEIQIGTPASRLEDACAPDHFDITKLPYITLLASNPESQICPLEGLYSLRSAIGPPHKVSRHKRNHNNNVNGNNKNHNQHNHHHHDISSSKRHTSLHKLNNNDEIGPKSLQYSSSHLHESISDENWQTINLLKRDRRLANEDVRQHQPNQYIHQNHQEISNDYLNKNENKLISNHNQKLLLNNEELIMNVLDPISFHKDKSIVVHNNNDKYNQNINHIPSETTSILITETINVLSQRSRRNTPGCIVNYLAQRQLLIGCTEPNIIDIRPQCTDDGEEVYYCHGTWAENSTTFVIAKHSGTQHAVCLTYQLIDHKETKLIIGDTCLRSHQKPSEHHLVISLKTFGKCGDPSSSDNVKLNLISFLILIGLTIFLNQR